MLSVSSSPCSVFIVWFTVCLSFRFSTFRCVINRSLLMCPSWVQLSTPPCHVFQPQRFLLVLYQIVVSFVPLFQCLICSLWPLLTSELILTLPSPSAPLLGHLDCCCVWLGLDLILPLCLNPYPYPIEEPCLFLTAFSATVKSLFANVWPLLLPITLTACRFCNSAWLLLRGRSSDSGLQIYNQPW